VDPRDQERLRDVMTQVRASYRSSLVNNGCGTASRQASRGLSAAAALDHLFVSPDALRFVEDLTATSINAADELMRNIEQIRDFLVKSRPLDREFHRSDTAFRSLTQTLEKWGFAPAL